MKLKLLLLFFLLPVLACAKHIEILGVPINGTISQFTTKFNNKGMKTEWTTSKNSGSETRWFAGTYYGRKCQFVAYYIPTNKVVYRVKVLINYGWGSTSGCENLVEEIKSALSNKYDIDFERDSFDGYPAWSGPMKEIVNVGEDWVELATIGWVDVYMNLDVGYVIHIDFYDAENYLKSQTYLDSTF